MSSSKRVSTLKLTPVCLSVVCRLHPPLHPTSVRVIGLMGGRCPAGRYWDSLVSRCLSCHLICQKPHATSRCTEYCESAHCISLPGHYYDRLLRTCIRCAEVCGSHPAECSQHCPAEPLALPTRAPAVEVTGRISSPGGGSVPAVLGDSTVLLYSLLALSMVLLLSSLSLALVVLLKMARMRTSKPERKKVERAREVAARPGQEVGERGRSCNGVLTKSIVFRPAEREPSEDSIPTETCACVHCFPDLRAPSLSDDPPQKATFSFYQQAVLQPAHVLKGGGGGTQEDARSSGMEVQEEATVRRHH